MEGAGAPKADSQVLSGVVPQETGDWNGAIRGDPVLDLGDGRVGGVAEESYRGAREAQRRERSQADGATMTECDRPPARGVLPREPCSDLGGEVGEAGSAPA